MEMLVLIDVLQQIRNNHTHKTFVEQLRPALDDMTEAVRHLLREIRVHFCAFAACPESLRGCVALVRRLSSPLRGANAHDANAKHHHHHRHHRRHSHHRQPHRPPSRYDPISPMVMRLSNADLDVEMMAMINNNDDDDSASESDGEEDDSDGDGDDDGDSDSDANGDDSEVSGEDDDRSTNSIVVTLDGGGDSSTDASKGGGRKDGRIDVEKATLAVAAIATTTDATCATAAAATTDGRDAAAVATIAAANNDNDNSVDGVSGADETPLHRLREARAGLLEGYRRTREMFVFPKAFPPPSPVLQVGQHSYAFIYPVACLLTRLLI